MNRRTFMKAGMAVAVSSTLPIPKAIANPTMTGTALMMNNGPTIGEYLTATAIRERQRAVETFLQAYMDNMAIALNPPMIWKEWIEDGHIRREVIAPADFYKA